MNRTTIGIDLGRKTKHRAAVLLPNGEMKGRPKSVNTSAQSLDRLIDFAGSSEQCDVVFEPTGMSWLLIAAYLLFKGCTVFRVDTNRACQFRKFISRNVKTDQIDALALARQKSADPEGMYPLVLPNKQQFSLDRMCRQRAQFVEDNARLKKRLEAAVDT